MPEPVIADLNFDFAGRPSLAGDAALNLDGPAQFALRPAGWSIDRWAPSDRPTDGHAIHFWPPSLPPRVFFKPL